MKTIILFTSILLLSLSLQAQKPHLPKGWLAEKDIPSPNMYRFKGNTFTMKTDRTLHYGYQYTTVCKINWVNDSTFTLEAKRKYTQDNNREGTRRRRGGNDTVFPLNGYTNWHLSPDSQGAYRLYSNTKLIETLHRNTFEITLIPME